MIIGELLNSSRKAIRPLMDAYDTEALRKIADAQKDAGADYLDLNCGAYVKEEVERLTWLVENVGLPSGKPLCLDSPNPAALKAVLPMISVPVVINSVSGEEQRYQDVLPLALEYKTKLVALCMAEGDIPQDAKTRCEIGARLIERLFADGMPSEDIYVDPLVQPASVSPDGARVILDTVSQLKAAYPEIHFVCGLSNISYGLPNRKLINRYFLAQIAAAGMDSFILDPTDKQLMGGYLVSQVLLGQDKFCAKYLKAHRKGLFE